jgi:hypothetical protein
MLLTRTSIVSGITRTKEIDVTQEELQRHENGELPQKIWPHLTDSDREFIISGMIDEEWTAVFPEEE